MSWTLQYYFHGCPSDTWRYPHHVAPTYACLALTMEEVGEGINDLLILDKPERRTC